VQTLGRPEQPLLVELLARAGGDAGLLVERRRPRALRLLGPREDDALARARHRDVEQSAHERLVDVDAVGRQGLAQECIRYPVATPARGTG